MSERLPPTRALALRVWWAYIWRVALGWIVLAFLAGALLGVTAMALSLPTSAMEGAAVVIGLLIYPALSIEIMYRLLKKRFSDFEIALVHRQD